LSLESLLLVLIQFFLWGGWRENGVGVGTGACAYLSLSGRGRGLGGGGCLFEAGRLLTFSTVRMGAYSRWVLTRGWALIRIKLIR